jgi:hypothetical protein
MRILRRTLAVVLCLLLIPVTAVTATAVKRRFEDGPSTVFSGGPLRAGELYRGPEPDWRFVNRIPTIEMQLVDPAVSRRIWTVEHAGRLYVWSGYMNSTVGRLWKQWPVQAERNGDAVLRIDGVRYERTLRRIRDGAELDGITAAIGGKYPARPTRASVESGSIWLFEAAPRATQDGQLR